MRKANRTDEVKAKPRKQVETRKFKTPMPSANDGWEEPRLAGEHDLGFGSVEPMLIVTDSKDKKNASTAEPSPVTTDLEKQIKALEKENKKLRASNTPKKKKEFTKNEEKVLTAIKSEMINQDKKAPIITRSTFLNKFGINNKYLGVSIDGLITKGYLEKKTVKFSGNINTTSYELLKM
jgi:hypothetical protein